MKKLSVLTLLDLNPTKFGALEEYGLRLSSELLKKGHFGVVGFSELPPTWLKQRYDSAGVPVVRVNPADGRIPLILNVRRVIRQYAINLVHATFYDIYSPALLMATIADSCKLVYSDQVSRTCRPKTGVRSTWRFLRNRLYQNFISAIIADAEFIRQCQIQDHFARPDKLTVIYNGVNCDRFRRDNSSHREDVLASLGISPNGFVLTTIAKCIPEKGLNYLLEAAQMVVTQIPNTTFVIVGDGPDRAKLERQAVTLGIRDKCIFTGMRVDTEVFLAISDVFVLLSVWEEAFAFSLLEAMASCCPVVSTRVGAIPESVQAGVTGILVPPRNANAAAAAMLDLLSNESLRLTMAHAARQRTLNQFSLEHWVDHTINLYAQILGRREPTILERPGSIC
jgi:glycosyltransferase involved in cell wall biosynthesis